VTLTFDLLTLKVVSESHVTWATPVPILVFVGLSVLDLGLMYATDRRQTKASLNDPLIRGGDIIIHIVAYVLSESRKQEQQQQPLSIIVPEAFAGSQRN